MHLGVVHGVQVVVFGMGKVGEEQQLRVVWVVICFSGINICLPIRPISLRRTMRIAPHDERRSDSYSA